MTQLIPSTTPVRMFEGHEARVSAVAIFSDKQRMVTCSYDAMLLLWDLTTGVVLKKMEGHSSRVQALAVSRDGRLIASGDINGKLFVWGGETGELLTQAISAHTSWILSLDFSRDGKVLASGSSDSTTKLWDTSTWQLHGHPIDCGANAVIRCVRYSPSASWSGEIRLLAIATEHNVQVYKAGYGYHNGSSYRFQARSMATIGQGSHYYSLAWTSDGTRLLSAGGKADIREWDSSTWQQVGEPFKGHCKTIRAISLNSNGTLLASASRDNHVRLWRLSDRRTIAVFKHSAEVNCVTFSTDGMHILSGGMDKKISEWPASEAALPENGLENGLMREQVTHQVKSQAYSAFKVLAINSILRNACIAGDWPIAEKVLNLEIDDGDGDHTSYANRAFVMARKCDWNRALHDAIQSLDIQPSFAGYISKGIVLCGKKQVRVARTSFELASMFTNGDLKTDHLLFFIKTIALFNASEHEEAMERVEELAVCPDVDPLACRIVEAYLRVQLGNIAFNGARYNEAIDHFAAAVNSGAFFCKLEIHSMYEEFVVLFGWDLKSLWQTANKQHCHALFLAGRIGAAVESYHSIVEKSDDAMKASICAWFAALQ